jgi:hypothetical protein
MFRIDYERERERQDKNGSYMRAKMVSYFTLNNGYREIKRR